MCLLSSQEKLCPQLEEYFHFLKSANYKSNKASFYARQMQDFIQSGLKPKDYFQKILNQDERAAETFLSNFREYLQFMTSQYFQDMMKTRWLVGKKYVGGHEYEHGHVYAQ